MCFLITALWLQVAAVVDHPALVVTRNVEWCAQGTARCIACHASCKSDPSPCSLATCLMAPRGATGCSGAGLHLIIMSPVHVVPRCPNCHGEYCCMPAQNSWPLCRVKGPLALHLSSTLTCSTSPLCRGTVIFGFEQANRYTVLDQNGNTVALMAEELGSLGTEVGRQFLRTRRPFKATVFGPDGQQVIFTVRRPFYFINRCAGPARNMLDCVRVQWAAGHCHWAAQTTCKGFSMHCTCCCLRWSRMRSYNQLNEQQQAGLRT